MRGTKKLNILVLHDKKTEIDPKFVWKAVDKVFDTVKKTDDFVGISVKEFKKHLRNVARKVGCKISTAGLIRKEDGWMYLDPVRMFEEWNKLSQCAGKYALRKINMIKNSETDFASMINKLNELMEMLMFFDYMFFYHLNLYRLDETRNMYGKLYIVGAHSCEYRYAATIYDY